jgi:hypothetical protein
MPKNKRLLTSLEKGIERKIYSVRGVQVMLDEDLASLYLVKTKALNQAVKRNLARFPEIFCFRLTQDEFSHLISQNAISSLRSQIVTSNYRGGRRYLPYVFTEQGVAMLSAVLKSETAIHMSIRIMSAFVSMRRTIRSNEIIFSRLENIEEKHLELKLDTDKKFEKVFNALSAPDKIPDKKIFFEGEVFDAHKFVSDLIRSAKSNIILIDNYLDDTVLDLFSKRRQGVEVTIYTQPITSSLTQDIDKFNEQYPPLIVKVLKIAHDRFLILDNTNVYHFGASIKDLGKKWFAVSRFDKHALTLLTKLKFIDNQNTS